VAGAIAALGQDTQRHLQRLHLLSISLSLLALALVVDTAHDESNDEYESTAHADANDQFAVTVAFRTAFGLFGRLLLVVVILVLVVVVILVLVVVVILVLRRVTSLEPVCCGRGARGPAGCWGWSRRREARVRSRSRASRHWCWCWCWAVFAHGSRS
jgi:ABC-type multidrug transport system fused ATPase/permease subunit